jgi:oxygen-independent coproporphyrinogen-3 oxidase
MHHEGTTTAPETRLDLDLIRKYAIAAPRYTSYPPATKFAADVPAAALEAAIAEDNGPGAGPLSLYFHLPFCTSACWYCGCNTIITRRGDAAAAYLDVLEREVALTAARLDLSRPVEQIHLGGGTPTFLTAAELRRLGDLVRRTFSVSEDCEFGVEIDPRQLSRDQVRALADIGANRASLGVQDTDPAVQLAIHRWQPRERNTQAVDWLREEGFGSINLDVIFGLPLQTVESFTRTLDDVLDLGPDRLSMFSYAHVPWIKPMQRIFEARRQLPGPEAKLAMFAAAHAKLTEAGYADIGMDHFAKPDDELAVAQRKGTLHRNFQGYSTKAGASLYAFGLSSISSTPTTYRQNLKGLEEWTRAVNEGRLPTERGLVLTREDINRRTLIMRLMCDRRLDYAALSERLGIDVAERYSAEIAGLGELEADGLVARSAGGLEVTPAGVPLLRIVAMHFDATFSGAPGLHSKAI